MPLQPGVGDADSFLCSSTPTASLCFQPDPAVQLDCRGGRGRHSFVFTRSTGMLSWLGFQVGLPPCVFRIPAMQQFGVRPCLDNGRDISSCNHAPRIVGFQVFAAVPFVYELREILDWSATATTLRLFDWLKLEVGTSIPGNNRRLPCPGFGG